MWHLILALLLSQPESELAGLRADLAKVQAQVAELKKAEAENPSSTAGTPGIATDSIGETRQDGTSPNLTAILAAMGGTGGAAGIGYLAYRRLRRKPDGSTDEEEIVVNKFPFKTGARRSPQHVIDAAQKHRARAFPPQFAVVPSFMEMWLNDQYGDCVSAEEAFAKAAYSIMCGLPETKITDATLMSFCTKYDLLNGADLASVIDQMTSDGFHQDGTTYTDGVKQSVDYSNEATLQSAISTGPVKIAIGSGDLPSGAGSSNGWYALGGGGAPNDHCTSLCGYGPAEYLYQQLGVALPSALAGKKGYLQYTWSTIGFVDHPWIMGTVQEAWVRNPTTPGITPVPPGPTPIPPVPPSPPVPGNFTPPFYVWYQGQKQDYAFSDLAGAITAAQIIAFADPTVTVKDSLGAQAWPTPAPGPGPNGPMIVIPPGIVPGNYVQASQTKASLKAALETWLKTLPD